MHICQECAISVWRATRTLFYWMKTKRMKARLFNYAVISEVWWLYYLNPSLQIITGIG